MSFIAARSAFVKPLICFILKSENVFVAGKCAAERLRLSLLAALDSSSDFKISDRKVEYDAVALSA
jgi:hypothetical protein